MEAVKRTIRKLIAKIHISNTIVFESEPEFSGSNREIFEEFLKRKLNDKYKIVWLINDKKKTWPQIKNVEFMSYNSNSIKRKLLSAHAKCLICENKFLTPADNKKQCAFYVAHGTPIKKLNGYHLPKELNYGIFASSALREIISQEQDFPIEKIKVLGRPLNDQLFSKNDPLATHFHNNFKKVIVWMPTFRQHKNGLKTACKNSIPLLENEANIKKLNKCAKEQDTLIVIKPHFAQDMSLIKELRLSNIQVIHDDIFPEYKTSYYSFIANCDALITDYSSVYFDYLLTDKPIAVVWTDLEDYKKKPGIAIDLDKYMSGANKIYQLDDFCDFIRMLAKDEDELKKIRLENKKLANDFCDNQSTKRAADFIIKTAKLN